MVGPAIGSGFAVEESQKQIGSVPIFVVISVDDGVVRPRALVDAVGIVTAKGFLQEQDRCLYRADQQRALLDRRSKESKVG